MPHRSPYLLPAALFFAGLIVLSVADGTALRVLNWTGELLSALGSIGMLWVWSNRRRP